MSSELEEYQELVELGLVEPLTRQLKHLAEREFEKKRLYGKNYVQVKKKQIAWKDIKDDLEN